MTESADTRKVMQGEVGSPPEMSLIQPFRIGIPEQATPDYRRHADNINILLDASDSFLIWTEHVLHEQTFLEGLDDPESEQSQSAHVHLRNLDSLLSSMRNLVNIEDLYTLSVESPQFHQRYWHIAFQVNENLQERQLITADTRTEFVDTLREQVLRRLDQGVEYFRSQTIPHPQTVQHIREISMSDEKLANMEKTFLDIIHDLNNTITPLIGSITFAKNRDGALPSHIYSNNMQFFLDQCRNIPTYLLEQYPLQKLSVSLFASLIKLNLFEKLPADISNYAFPIAPENLTTQILYAKVYLIELLANIAQNAVKSIQAEQELHPDKYKRETPAVNVRYIFSEDGKFFIVIIEDNGKGFPEGILNNGFDGASEWGTATVQGTGVGMKRHANILQHYKGTIIPENIIEDGGVMGGRLKITFPIVFASAINTDSS